MNLVPVENQLSSGQPLEEQQRRITAAETERFEPEEEIEYVELEDRRRDAIPQRRYLDEPMEDPYLERDLYRGQPPLGRPPLEREPRELQPRELQPRDPEPRRAMPASRRTNPSQREPMDVEPLPRREPEPMEESNLDDPW